MGTDYKDINYKNGKIINLRNPALFSQEALLELLDLYKEVDCNEDFKYTKDNKSSKKNIRTFCIHKFDKKTILPSEKKGGSCFLTSIKNDELVILLGKEKNGKYQGAFNLFGGHYEEATDYDCAHTAKREFGEEFNPRYIYDTNLKNWIKWCGSPWAFNTTHIEFGLIKENFNVNKAFRDNEEMSSANWFPLRNFITSSLKKSSNRFLVKDINDKYHEVSCYAHGVVNAAHNNKHFRI